MKCVSDLIIISDIIMESDDENLIIPPEHLNLSDEPELELSDEPIPDPGAALGADNGPAQASGDQGNTAPSTSRVKAAAVMDTEWDTFQMSIARSGPALVIIYHRHLAFKQFQTDN